MRAATAIELVHMATLVHDDVLDDAPLRRGRPTVAATSGRERAVGAGDLLFSRAFARAGRRRRTPARSPLLADASVALARGELAQRHDAFDTSITEERYLERCRLKTARLFECACRLGRLASDGPGSGGPGAASAPRSASPSSCSTTSSTSRGPPERTGKARGTDLLDGTVTLPLILARRARPGDRATSTCSGARSGRRAEELCDRIAATGALDQVRARAGWGSSAPRRLIASQDFTDEERQLLGLVADGVVERYS